MRRLFVHAYAPSTLGSFLREFTFGHVRQLDAVAARFLAGLGERSPVVAGVGEYALVDVDDSVVEVHGYAKAGAGFGYSGVRGLNAALATVSTPQAAPVVLSQRLRKGAAHSARAAKRLVADALSTLGNLRGSHAAGRTLLRADSAFYGHATIGTARRAGAEVSVTVRMDAAVRAAIAQVRDDAWTTIEYPQAVFDQASGRWVSRAEVAETPFTAFSSQARRRRVPGRLVVRRIPELNPKAKQGQPDLFALWRHHAFFTTTDPEVLDTVAADQTHRQHAVIEQVHADLKDSALAHLPSGKFAANAAWLVLAVMALNLTPAAAATLAGHGLARATTATIRRKLITVPARIACSARRFRLHLPAAWPWEKPWQDLFTRVSDPPAVATT